MMQKVYESSTAPEAHMVKILLESKGIYSRIDGEHLASGSGVLQAINVVRVLVEDSDFITASEIIEQWESDQSNDVTVNKSKSKPTGLIGFLIGLALSSGIFYWIYNTPVTVDGIDYNADGKLDEKWEYKNNRISKSTHDRNLDGKVDQIVNFGTSGIIYSSELDIDFDGFFETKQYYKKGNAYLEESDLNNNGIVDYRIKLKFGQLDTIEFIDEQTGKIRKRQIYLNGKLKSAVFDSNGDGNFDKNYSYDLYEEIGN